MIEKLSNNISQFFCKNNIISEDEYDIYKYGLELLLAAVFEIGFVLILSIILKIFIPTMIFFVSFIPLRIYTGGYHASNHLRCFLTLLFVYLIFILSLKFLPNSVYDLFCIYSAIFSAIIILLFAPVEDANKPLCEKEVKYYRKKSILVLIIQAIILAFLFVGLRGSVYVLSFSFGQISVAFSIIIAILKRKGGSLNEQN